MPSAVLLWAVVLIGPDFVIEARWGPVRFPDRDQCEIWLSDALRKGVANLRADVKAECRPIGSAQEEIEE
jgi:hypothetical protein